MPVSLKEFTGKLTVRLNSLNGNQADDRAYDWLIHHDQIWMLHCIRRCNYDLLHACLFSLL